MKKKNFNRSERFTENYNVNMNKYNYFGILQFRMKHFSLMCKRNMKKLDAFI